MVTTIDNTLDAEARVARAMELRARGCNCCQSVALAFADLFPTIPAESLEALTSGFGGGVGARGDLCGVVSAMTLVASHASYPANPAPDWKKLIYAKVRSIADEFEQREGSVNCRSLKGELRRPCDQLIAGGVRQLHKALAGQ